MSDILPKTRTFEIDGIERKVFFSFSVIDKIQEKYEKGFDEVMREYLQLFVDEKISQGMKMTAELLEIFANDQYIYPDPADRHPVKPGYFYSVINHRNVTDAFGLIWEQYMGDLPEADEDEDPNLKSAETIS